MADNLELQQVAATLDVRLKAVVIALERIAGDIAAIRAAIDAKVDGGKDGEGGVNGHGDGPGAGQ